MAKPFVHAFPNTLEHLQAVDRNVSPVLNVPWTEPVSIKSVLTHVQELVVLTHDVTLIIIAQFVLVYLDIREIPSHDVTLIHVRLNPYHILAFS